MDNINVLQFITPTGLYGAEMWILALAKNLDPQKVNCQLAVTLESEDHDIEIYNKFRILELKAYQIKMRGRFDPLCIIRLYKLIRRKKIDIIHTHGYKSDILGLLAARLSGIRAIATPHGFGVSNNNIKLKLFTSIGCFALKYFDRVAPLSEKLESELIKIKVPDKSIRRILNGIDLNEIDSARQRISEVNFNGNEKRIIYIGRLVHGKNIDHLINIFDLLYKEYENIRLIIIGDGELRDELKNQACLLPSSKKIEFLGYREDRLVLLKECDIFCMTSSSEGIPRCMMEAMAMEIPVVAYDIPGVDKLIVNGKTGLTAKFGQTEDLKECWKRLLFEDAFSKQVAINARKHITENFSAKRMAEEYTDLYSEIIKNT